MFIFNNKNEKSEHYNKADLKQRLSLSASPVYCDILHLYNIVIAT